MTKTKRARAKKKSVPVSSPRTPEIKKVALSPATIVQVAIPKGLVPVVAIDASKNIVEIVPVAKKKKTWWQSVFG